MDMQKEHDAKLARIAKALSHPSRIAILRFLSKQTSCYFGDISKILPVSKATVSQHLAELKNAKLIIGEIQAPKVLYCLDRKAWIEAMELMTGLMDESDKKCEEK